MAEGTNFEPGEILAAVDSLREQAVGAARKLAEELELERRVRENPMETLAIAAGAGFLLGGGLWPVLRPFLRATGKALMSPQNLVALAAAAGAIRAARGGEQESGSPPVDPGTSTAH